MPAADHTVEDSRLPRSLPLAAGVVAIEALLETLYVSGREELTPGLRVMLILCLGLKWLFAWLVVRRSAGAALGLLLLELTTVVAAFGAVDQPKPARFALGLAATTVIALVAASLHAFPPPTLPRP